MAIIKGVRRRQGFIVKKGNPLNIRSVRDITPEIRYINRQKGAGTRVLFDYLLKKEGISPANIQGYENEAATHMSVAVAVQKDNADTGMGIYSCAKALGLDFVDAAFEEYDFVTYAEYLELPAVQEFLCALTGEEFGRRLDELGGYSREEIGNPVHRGTREKLREHGISAAGKCAVQLKKSDYEKYDYLLGMETWNISNIMRIIGSDPDHKVHRLLDFSDHPRDIADPWYTGNFDVTYDDIEEGCEALLAYLEKKGEIRIP